MNKVRIIVKRTYQPPIDTLASIRWITVEIVSKELFKLLYVTGDEKGDDKYTSSTVVGAEPIEPHTSG